MSFQFPCGQCGAVLAAQSRKIGQRAKCPRCKAVVLVPDVDEALELMAGRKSARQAAAAARAATSEGHARDEARPEAVEHQADLPDHGARRDFPRDASPAAPATPREPAAAALGAAAAASDSDADGDDDPFAEFKVFDLDDDEAIEVLGSARAGPRRVVDDTKVAVPRGVLYAQGGLLAAVGVFCFVAGVVCGGFAGPRGGSTAVVADCVVSGRVEYLPDGRNALPDEGAVVFIFRDGLKPDQKAPVEGARPRDLKTPADHPLDEVLNQVGGQFTRTDLNGRFSLIVREHGPYHLVAISRRARRPAEQSPQREHVATVGNVFTSAVELIGDQQCVVVKLQLRGDHTENIRFR